MRSHTASLLGAITSCSTGPESMGKIAFPQSDTLMKQSRTEELRPGAENCTCAMAIERLDVSRAIPTRTNDLSQSLGVILIILVDLHLEGGARMPCVEANHVEPEIAKFMHNPRRHGAGFNPNPRIIARISTHRGPDILREVGRSAAPGAPTDKTCGSGNPVIPTSSGTERHWPRHILRPSLSTTQIAVDFCETFARVTLAVVSGAG
jgi:hypothetical protein